MNSGKVFKVGILTLASLFVVFESYKNLEPSLKFAPFSRAIPVGWHYKVIRPFCNCSPHQIEYILVEKMQAKRPLDDDVLIVNLVQEKVESSVNYEDNNNDELSTSKVTKTYLFNLTLTQAKQFTKTCDLFNVLRRGLHQKVISYSFYGRNSKYSNNLEGIVELMRLKYKGYTARVHYDSSINLAMRCHLECEYPDVMDFCNMNAFSTDVGELIVTTPPEETKRAKLVDMSHMHKMMWRFLPVGDSFVDIFMSRDTDSYFSDREIDAVNQWLASNKPVHIMRGILGLFFLQNYYLRSSKIESGIPEVPGSITYFDNFFSKIIRSM